MAEWNAICEFGVSVERQLHKCTVSLDEWLLSVRVLDGQRSGDFYRVPHHQIQSIFRRDSTELELLFKTLDVWRIKLDSGEQCESLYSTLSKLFSTMGK